MRCCQRRNNVADLDSGLTTACSSLDADAVKEIIDTDLTDARINRFLNAAYFTAKPISGNLTDCGGSSMFCEIVLWLAAHLITVYERQVKSESVAGEWSVTYLGKEGMGLEASLYGQQVLQMDCSGMLAKTVLKRATFDVISYEDLEEQTPSSGYLD